MIPTDKGFKSVLRALLNRDFCGEPATFTGPFGDRCTLHAEELVKRLQSPHALINVLAGRVGMTEARARKFIQPIE